MANNARYNERNKFEQQPEVVQRFSFSTRSCITQSPRPEVLNYEKIFWQCFRDLFIFILQNITSQKRCYRNFIFVTLQFLKRKYYIPRRNNDIIFFWVITIIYREKKNDIVLHSRSSGFIFRILLSFGASNFVTVFKFWYVISKIVTTKISSRDILCHCKNCNYVIYIKEIILYIDMAFQ